MTVDGETVAGYVRAGEAYAVPVLGAPNAPLAIYGEDEQQIGYFGADSFAVIEVKS